MQHLGGRKEGYTLCQLSIRKHRHTFLHRVKTLVHVVLVVWFPHWFYPVLRGKEATFLLPNKI